MVKNKIVKNMSPEKVKELSAAMALFYASGMDEKQIKKPHVAIIYSPNSITPGHFSFHLEQLVHHISLGISEAGGYPVPITAGVGLCDGIAMGHDGMKFSLPSRQTNYDAAIDAILGNGSFKGAVYIGACDKNIPGYLMALASLHMPAIVVTSGPMLPGCAEGKETDVVNAFVAESLYKSKKINKKQYDEIIKNCCPGPGTCRGLFTANSMACVTEGLGLTVPGMATAHASESIKYRLATQSGRQIMKLIKKGITARDILTKKAFENALRIDLAIGASTNTVLHLPAIAEEAGYYFDLDEINKISESTPNILSLSPASVYGMKDFDKAGGIPVIMKRLRELLDTKVQTVTGILEERIINTQDDGVTSIIKGIGNPYSKTGGIAVYKGNLATEGAVIKESAVDPSFPKVFRGIARVFNDEAEFMEKYISAGKAQEGDFIVIRYEGPAGGPGMREMLYPTAAIKGLGLKRVALGTDGRFSGGTIGPCFGHIAPEAFNKGLLAYVINGDIIEVNKNSKQINLMVSEKEINQRKTTMEIYEKPIPHKRLEKVRAMYTKR